LLMLVCVRRLRTGYESVSRSGKEGYRFYSWRRNVSAVVISTR
jgi:hypothetical protein